MLNDLYKAGGGYRYNREGAPLERYDAKVLCARRDMQELLRVIIEHDDSALQDIPAAFRRARHNEPPEVRARHDCAFLARLSLLVLMGHHVKLRLTPLTCC